MKRQLKNKIITLLTACFCIAAAAGTATALSVNAETPDASRFVVKDGAYIRVEQPYGLRFVAEIGSDVYADLTTDDGTVKKMGVYVVPNDYLTDEAQYTNGETDMNGKKYQNLTTKLDYVFYDSSTNENKLYAFGDYYYGNAVITNLYLNNFDRDFVAIGYKSVTDSETTTYTFTEISENNVRNATEIAGKGYADYFDSEYKSVMDEYILGSYLKGKGMTETTEDGNKKYTYNATDYETISAASAACNFSVSLNKQSAIVYLDGEKEIALTATVKDGETAVTTQYPVIWTSSNIEVATVDGAGNVTAIAKGNATITANFLGKAQATATITVYDSAVSVHNGTKDSADKVVLNATAYGTDQETLPTTSPNYGNACKGKTDQSYVSFNGNYGLNDYLVFDFTGNNFPYITFFDKNVENHVFNHGAIELIPKNEAVVISNGVTINTGEPFSKWAGSVNNRLSVVGPYGAFDMGGDHSYQYFRTTVTGSNNNELAVAKLAAVAAGQEKSYRVMIGFTAGTSTSFTFSMYVTNLSDGSIVFNGSHSVTSRTALSDNYYSGNIALYGQFGKTTTIDKIYAIEEDTTLDALKAKYVSPITLYKGTRTGDQVVLQASTYVGDNTPTLPTTAGRNPDMSYVAFNGKYGLNDFLVFDFTGDNLPFISFFNTNVTNSCLNLSTARDSASGGPYQDIDKTRKSWVIANGIRLKNGTDTGTIYGGETGAHASRLVLFGPYGIVRYDGDKADSSSGGPQWRQVIAGSATAPSPISMRQLLSATDPYRMIVGYTAGDNDSSVKLCIYVVNLNTKATVVNSVVTINHTDYEEGSIVLYSQFYNGGTTLDKIYPIFEDTTLDEVKKNLTN